MDKGGRMRKTVKYGYAGLTAPRKDMAGRGQPSDGQKGWAAKGGKPQPKASQSLPN